MQRAGRHTHSRHASHLHHAPGGHVAGCGSICGGGGGCDRRDEARGDGRRKVGVGHGLDARQALVVVVAQQLVQQVKRLQGAPAGSQGTG